MSEGIILARPGARIMPCQACQRPFPDNELWRGSICRECWAAAGGQMGWRLNDEVLLFLSRLLQPHVGERGSNEDLLKCLRRLLEERERLLAWAEEERVIMARCCYCREPARFRDGVTVLADGTDLSESNLCLMECGPGLPTLWRCVDEQVCLARLVRSLAPEGMRSGGVA